ncbi:MAG: biotin--[acetyl-CoA-carboxylase] ligase [Gammaproteobacteria bacterium]|nr:biotin--[acetyl-CoA-carboxylase] ligase [Gammaproteobacteria bacterium]
MQTACRSWHPIDIVRSLESAAPAPLQRVSVLDLCTSTNDYLLSRRPPIKDKFNLCVAAAQSAGRGRHGKTWCSNHRGVYLSVSWRVVSNLTNGGWLLLMTAVRLAESLRVLGISDISIKWPNDLYYKDAKLAGMLIEQRNKTAVMGLGLNIATPPATAPEAKTSWVGLEQTGIAVPRYSELIALVATAALAVGEQIDFDEGKRRFSEFDMLYNRSVEINKQGKKISAVAQGIDRQARLLVDNEGQIDAYGYGEISVHNDGITDRCRQQPL